VCCRNPSDKKRYDSNGGGEKKDDDCRKFHFSLENVQEHAPPLAGAHVETGEKVHVTGDVDDRAASGGCVSRLVRNSSFDPASVAADGVPKALVGVESMRREKHGDSLRALSDVLNRLWVGIRNLVAVNGVPDEHHPSRGIGIIRPVTNKENERAINNVLPEVLAISGEHREPEMIGKHVLNGGVVGGPLEAAASNFGDEPLRLNAASGRISERLCACPGDHGNSKSEMVRCAMLMWGFFLPNVKCAPTGAVEGMLK